MPASGRLSALVRALRLMAALSLVVALAADAAIVNGGTQAKCQALVAAAIILGCFALLGLALLALSYIPRKKDQNDPRS